MAQYSTDANLAHRIALHRYSVHPVSWPEWYLGHLDVRNGERLLDIGCGNANLWVGRQERIPPGAEVHLADSSPGMLDAARVALDGAGPNWRFEIANVCDLPYPDACFNFVLANHMLYHAEDIDRAISEIARVLKPTGRLLASTNGARHMAELIEWTERRGITVPEGVAAHVRRFGLENAGEMLETRFGRVELDRYEDSLSVPEVEPIVRYILSMEPPDTPETRRGVGTLREELERELRSSGAITIGKESGLFIATQPKHGGSEDA